MEGLTGYHKRACELTSDLVRHGFGEMSIRVRSNKDNTVIVEFRCGKIYLEEVKKKINLENIL